VSSPLCCLCGLRARQRIKRRTVGATVIPPAVPHATAGLPPLAMAPASGRAVRGPADRAPRDPGSRSLLTPQLSKGRY